MSASLATEDRKEETNSGEASTFAPEASRPLPK
jgi:hypothetical protein